MVTLNYYLACGCVEDKSISNECDAVSGQCPCYPGATGTKCDACEPGMYQCNSPDGAQECGCNVEGTVDASIECAEVTGECTCIDTVVGLQCDQCEDQHWNFPNCLRESFINFSHRVFTTFKIFTACACDVGGSVDNHCHTTDGKCTCNDNVIGHTCDKCDDGFYLHPTCHGKLDSNVV